MHWLTASVYRKRSTNIVRPSNVKAVTWRPFSTYDVGSMFTFSHLYSLFQDQLYYSSGHSGKKESTFDHTRKNCVNIYLSFSLEVKVVEKLFCMGENESRCEC